MPKEPPSGQGTLFGASELPTTERRATVPRITYPASTGRNFQEILRTIDSLQLTDKHKVATPADWKQGEDVIIVPSLDKDAARGSSRTAGPKHKPYLRTVPQPQENEAAE